MATLVQIKRSSANAIPGSLQIGELAYSYNSNVLFVGTAANTVINIGGKFYTDLIDGATSANGASNFVRRYANGSSQFQQLDILVGPTSNTHVATKEYVDSAITANISLNTLTDVIVVGTSVEQNNRILIGHANGQYITTDVTGNVTLSNTGVAVIGSQQVVGSMLADNLVGDKTFANTITIGENLTVTGNLYVLGNTTTVNTETLTVEDSLIKLASNNATDVVDIGFVGQYDSTKFAGLYRDATDNRFKLFTDYAGGDPTANVLGATARATLEANLSALVVHTATLNVTSIVANGHTILTSANLSATLNVAGDALFESNVSISGTANVNGILTTNNNAIIGGDLTVSGGDIISTATANLLNVTSTTINIGGAATDIRIGSGSGATVINHNLNVAETSRANTFVSTRTALSAPSTSTFAGERLRLFDFDQAGRPNYAIGAEASHIWMGVDSSANTEGWKFYGNTSLAARLSANGILQVSNTIITTNISAANLILSTPLGVGSGGTGKSSLTANGVFYADTSSSFEFATGTEGQVLQITAGIPGFAMLDGGSF